MRADSDAELQLCHRGREGGAVFGGEERGTGDKGIRSSLTAFDGVGEVHTAVHFEAEIELAGVSPSVDLGNLR